MNNGPPTGHSAPTLSDLTQGFLLTQQTEGRSNYTVIYYRNNLHRFLWYAQQHHWPTDIRQITTWHVRDFLGYVGSATRRWAVQGNGSESSSRRASPRTVHHYYAVLRAFFNWAVSEGLLDESPMARITVRKPIPRVIPTFTREDIQAMLAVCDMDYQQGARLLGSRNKAIILVLLDTGVRASELVGMTLRDLDRERGLIKVLGKGAKERMVRIGKSARKALWRYLLYRPDGGLDAVWLTEEGRPLQVHGLQSMIERLCARAAITGVRCSPHTFRHTFAVNYLRNGGNVFELQYLPGHSSLDIVKRYVATLGMMDALDGHARASPVDNLLST